MEIQLNKNQFYLIIKRIYLKFKLRRKPNPTKEIFLTEDIVLVKAYIFPCIYSNNENIKKENLVIKYIYNKEIISLNILLDDYKDLL